MAWDKTKPIDAQKLKDLAALIRANWDAIELLTDAALQITNAKVAANAGIVDTKLAEIGTANKVNGTAIKNLAGIPPGAGTLPVANLPTPDGANVTAVPSDHTASGMTISLKAHANVSFGDVCYINSDGEAQLLDADAIASMTGIVLCADASISANATGKWLLIGIARDASWTWTVGGLVYGSVTGTSGNTMSQTAPTAVDDVIQILGVATHANRIYFNPQLQQIEHA